MMEGALVKFPCIKSLDIRESEKLNPLRLGERDTTSLVFNEIIVLAGTINERIS